MSQWKELVRPNNLSILGLKETLEGGQTFSWCPTSPNSWVGCFRSKVAELRFKDGMLFWKTQSPWPSFRGYMYDSYLETNGGFWGLVAATEGGKHGSLHVQLGNWTENLSIVVINRQTDFY